MVSARQILQDQLRQWGLDSLVDVVWQQITVDATPEQVVAAIRGTDVYRTRFAAITQRQAAGLPAVSEADVIAYETQARQLMRAHGLPAGFYDQSDDFVRAIAGDVSINELNDRVRLAATAVNDEPPETRDELERLYGVAPGDLVAYMLDPDRALPLIERRARAAQIAGAARTTGFGVISAEDAERAASLTSSPEQARQGFAQIAGLGELREGIIGERGEARFTDRELINSTFGGDSDVKQRLSRRQRARQAEFAQSGGLLRSTSAGAVGAGTAQ